MKRILVTGGAGFIGHYVIKKLLADERIASILMIDKLTYAANSAHLKWQQQHSNYRFIKADIASLGHIRQVILDYKPDIMINVAAESHVDNSIDDVIPFINSNIYGVVSLLELCRQLKDIKFVQVSTDETYGPSNGIPFAEDAPRRPQNPYAASKASAEMLVESFVNTHNLTALITRGCNTFGRGQAQEKLIPKLIALAKQNLPLTLYGNGLQKREWLSASDHARAIIHLALGSYTGVYNIGSGYTLTNLALAELILKYLVHSKSKIMFVKDRPGHDWAYGINSNKLYRTGFSINHSFEDYLKDCIRQI